MSAPDGEQLEVRGLAPVQQGSKSARIGGYKDGKPWATMFDQNAKTLKPWRVHVAGIAQVAAIARRREGKGPLDGPLHCSISFRFEMPSSRRKADRVRGWLWKSTMPDLDKLFRAVGDSLTDAELITDDARFASIAATKIETTDPDAVGCTIQVYALDVDGQPAPIVPLSPVPDLERPTLL